jgi:hypothetical protein
MVEEEEGNTRAHLFTKARGLTTTPVLTPAA